MNELKRQRLQTLARGLSGKDTLSVVLGSGCSHVESDQIIYISDREEIIPGVPATKGERLLVQKANCAHEAAHIRYTDLSAWEKATRSGISRVVNILEDARVEAAISEKFPGARDWMRFANNYYLVKGAWNTIGGIFCIYALTGKIPPSATAEARALVKKCRPLINKAVRAASTWEVLEIAREVIQILKEHQDEIPDQPPPRGTYAPETRVTAGKNPQTDTDQDIDQDSIFGSDEPEKDSWSSGDDAGAQKPDSELSFSRGPEEDEEPDTGSTGDSDIGPPDQDADADPSSRDTDQDAGTDAADEPASSEPVSGGEEEQESGELSPSPEESGDDISGETRNSNSDAEEPAEPGISDADEAPGSGSKDTQEPESKGADEDAAESAGPSSSSPEEEGTPEECGSDSEPEEATGLDEFVQLVDQANEEAEALERGQQTASGSPSPPSVDPAEIARGLSGLNESVPFKIDSGGDISLDLFADRVKHLIHAAAREIRESLLYKTRIPELNLRKGAVHSGSLWKLGIPDPKIFHKIRQPSSIPDIALYMLLDCSGSMIAATKHEPACEAAYLLMGVCKKLNIPAAVTGFSDCMKVTHYPVLNFDGSGSGRISLGGSNRDGFSIRVATGEVLARPERKKIIVVISDGLPNYQDHGRCVSKEECYRDTALAVREAAKKGVGVIGIHIGALDNLPWVQKIYPNFIHLEKVEYLPKLMARVLKKIILEEVY